MGFGHRVYKSYDPRAAILKKACAEVIAARRQRRAGCSRSRCGSRRSRSSDEYFVSRKLYPNVDFYSGVIYKALGIPVNMFTVMFAIGRLPGWIAQWLEMRARPRLPHRPPAAGLHRPDAARVRADRHASVDYSSPSRCHSESTSVRRRLVARDEILGPRRRRRRPRDRRARLELADLGLARLDVLFDALRSRSRASARRALGARSSAAGRPWARLPRAARGRRTAVRGARCAADARAGRRGVAAGDAREPRRTRSRRSRRDRGCTRPSFDLDHAGREPRHERAVVRHDHDRARILRERVLEHLLAGEIEVMRGLVEQEQVRAAPSGCARARRAGARRPTERGTCLKTSSPAEQEVAEQRAQARPPVGRRDAPRAPRAPLRVPSSVSAACCAK